MKFWTLSMLLLAGLATGCTQENAARSSTSKVTGAVIYKGAPLTTGTVNFFSADTGAAGSTEILGTGEFVFPESLQTGTYQVYLSPTPPGPPENGAPPPTIVPLEVPEKYLKLETSDLKATVNPGEGNTIELKLED